MNIYLQNLKYRLNTAVKVILHLHEGVRTHFSWMRQLVMDNCSNIFYIKTSSCNICCNEDSSTIPAEAIHCLPRPYKMIKECSRIIFPHSKGSDQREVNILVFQYDTDHHTMHIWIVKLTSYFINIRVYGAGPRDFTFHTLMLKTVKKWASYLSSLIHKDT